MTSPSNPEQSAPLPRRERLGVSLLIPTYNYACAHLVCELQKQCEEVQATVEGFDYEIIVAEDGSTDDESIRKNSVTELLPHCRYELRDNNVGRAAIRNWLVSEASYEWVVIIDSDAEVMSDDFVQKYITMAASTPRPDVIVGGIATPDHKVKGHELRYKYEHAAEKHRTLTARRARPELYFSTFNFMARRSILADIPFDERCKEYGYEDALLGIELAEKGCRIEHIDNPLLHNGINSNASFLANTEAALRTLRHLGPPMTSTARVAQLSAAFTKTALRRSTMKPLLLLIYNMSRPLLRLNLLSSHPSLHLFAFYKLGYYTTLP